jgi:hypothetical protein
MSRNPTLAPASGPLHVAIVSADPLVRAGLASIIEPELGSGRIVDDLDQADVALWDTGANLDQVLGHLAQIDSVDMPVLALGRAPRSPGRRWTPGRAAWCCATAWARA